MIKVCPGDEGTAERKELLLPRVEEGMLLEPETDSDPAWKMSRLSSSAV